MAFLYRRGRVWWLQETRDGVRVRRSLRTRDRAEAELRAQQPEPPTVSEALDRYRAFVAPRRAKKTNQVALGYLRNAFEGMGVRRTDETTYSRLVDYLTRQASQGAAPQTLNHIRQHVRLFYAWLVDTGQARENPAERVRAFYVPAPRIRFLEAQDIARLQEALRGDLIEPVALTALWAGLRRSELIWLDLADIDLERGLLAVRAKGPWQPKTRRNRLVPIAAKLRPVLRAAASQSANRELAGCEPLRAHAFPAPMGGRWEPSELSRRFRRLMDQAALPWTLLDLRRTFGSHVVRNPGMTFGKLAALMGNSAAICARHYAHVASEDLAGDVDF